MKQDMRLVFERQHRNRWPCAVRYSEEANSFYPESPSARRDADERSILWKGYQSAWQHRQQEIDKLNSDLEISARVCVNKNAENIKNMKEIDRLRGAISHISEAAIRIRKLIGEHEQLSDSIVFGLIRNELATIVVESDLASEALAAQQEAG